MVIVSFSQLPSPCFEHRFFSNGPISDLWRTQIKTWTWIPKQNWMLFRLVLFSERSEWGNHTKSAVQKQNAHILGDKSQGSNHKLLTYQAAKHLTKVRGRTTSISLISQRNNLQKLGVEPQALSYWAAKRLTKGRGRTTSVISWRNNQQKLGVEPQALALKRLTKVRGRTTSIILPHRWTEC